MSNTFAPATTPAGGGMKKGPFGRPVRVPLGTRNVLTASQRKGFVRRFVNDEPGRIQEYEGAGYTVVKEETPVGDNKVGKGKGVGSEVSVPVGDGKTAVLMEIREDWYQADQTAKQDDILRAENDMKRKLNTRGGGTYGKVDIR